MIIANWKANGETQKNLHWCETFINSTDNTSLNYVGISPSSIHFKQLQNFFIETSVMIGIQDVDFEGGSRTGSISTEMASA